jgi:hypothetical protein
VTGTTASSSPARSGVEDNDIMATPSLTRRAPRSGPTLQPLPRTRRRRFPLCASRRPTEQGRPAARLLACLYSR